MPRGNVGARSICWDCERACAGCSWSRRFKPVPGWNALPAKLVQRDGPVSTYIVLECPQFKRDAYNYGMKWSNKSNEIIRRSVPKKNETGIHVKP